jgi:hypothetical protein
MLKILRNSIFSGEFVLSCRRREDWASRTELRGIFPGQEVLKTNVDCSNQGCRIISDNLGLPMNNEEEIIKDKSLPGRSIGPKN